MALESLWGSAAVNTWNARRAAVGKWLSWCREQGWDAAALPATARRSTPPDSDTPVRSRTAIDRLIARRDLHIREKTLWRMLYETCARADELLQVNIEDLDPVGRCCPVKSKGAHPPPRRRPPRIRPGDRALGRRHRLAAAEIDQGPQRRAAVRHPPPPRAQQVPRRPRHLPRPRTRGCPTTRRATCSTPPPRPPGPEPVGTCTNSGIPDSRISVNPGPACSNSWPSPATANPRTCAATSNHRHTPCATSPASSAPEPTAAADQQLHELRCFLRHYYRDPHLGRQHMLATAASEETWQWPGRRIESAAGSNRIRYVECR